MHHIVRRDMLAQELRADVHQRNRIERGTALLGAVCRVRRDARERVLRLQRCHAASGNNFVSVLRMPGQRGIELCENAVTREKRFCRAALFAGTAEEDHGAFAALGKICLDRNGCRKRACAQKMMTAAVTAAARNDRGFLRAAALLRKTVQRVELAEQPDHGFAAAERAGKRRLNAADVRFNGETLAAEKSRIDLGGVELLQRKLGMRPNIARQRNKGCFLFFDY